MTVTPERRLAGLGGWRIPLLAPFLWALAVPAAAQTPIESPIESPIETGQLPDHFSAPLAFAAAGHVSLDDAFTDYLGMADDPAACDRDTAYIDRLQGIGLITAYYGLAEHLFLGGSLIQDGWGYAVYDDWFAADEGGDWTTAGDLLKTVPADLREAWIDHAVDALPADHLPPMLAAVDAYLEAFGPMTTFAENDPDRAATLVADLYAGRVPLSLAGTGLPDVGDACDHHQIYLHLEIGSDETYIAIPTVSTVVRTFWLRRHDEGNHRLVHDLLTHAHAALQTRIETAPPLKG